MLSFEDKVEICRNNDHNYDGEFFLAVKSTQIFCLPSCKAKFPKMENIEFYLSKDQALSHGYRGCKRCRSEFYPHTEPTWVSLVKHELHLMIESKLDNKRIEEVAGVNLSTIKKYFKRYVGYSPARYHRKIKLELAREKIILGEDYRDVCFELGFESVSGFREAYKKEFNQTPGDTQ